VTRTVALRWAFAGCVLSVLFLALAPVTPQLPTTGWDKSNHLLAFGALAALGRGAFPGRWAVVLLGLLAFGGLIELLQSLTDYRSAEWGDLLADGVALGFAWLVCQLHLQWRARSGAGVALGESRR
jgi:VanZ family protein